MINLITGLPGNGKTLFALKAVKTLADKENRPVFYSGIADLKIEGWTEIEADKWHLCPPGSIILIDECQRVFRPRANGSLVPPHVAALETHRHGGLDLFLVTQHPRLADVSVRSLTGRHLHVVRKWGTESATVHEWPEAHMDCEKPTGRKDSIKHAFKYPREVYSWYKSAELHTVRRNIPMQVYMIGVFGVLFLVLAYYQYTRMAAKVSGEDSSVPVAVDGGLSPGAISGNSSGGLPARVIDPIEDAKQYVHKITPRVVGMAHTAPMYDELTKPTSVPMPKACVYRKSKNICNCYSQQGTLMPTPKELCADIVARGYFQDFNPEPDVERRSSEMSRFTSPAAGTVSAASGGSVVLDGEGYGVLGRKLSSGLRSGS